MKNPQRLGEIEVIQERGSYLARLKSGELIALSALDAMVLRAADGTRDIQSILAVAQDADHAATRESVFMSLDRLADVGLLTARATPPGHGSRTTRRDLMRLVGTAAACAVVSAPVASAFGQDSEARRRGEVAFKLDSDAYERVPQERYHKQEYRAAEETVKTERRDVIEAEQNLNSAERRVRAAEREYKRNPRQPSEQHHKAAERDLELAARVAEKERKEFDAARARAVELRNKYQVEASDDAIQ